MRTRPALRWAALACALTLAAGCASTATALNGVIGLLGKSVPLL